MIATKSTMAATTRSTPRRSQRAGDDSLRSSGLGIRGGWEWGRGGMRVVIVAANRVRINRPGVAEAEQLLHRMHVRAGDADVRAVGLAQDLERRVQQFV